MSARYGNDGIGPIRERDNTMESKSIKRLQEMLPWGAHEYSDAFKAYAVEHRDFAHGLLHLQKAIGKIANVVDDADHTENVRGAFLAEGLGLPTVVDRYLADLVIIACRMANVCPGKVIDLQEAIDRRLLDKFPIPKSGEVILEDESAPSLEEQMRMTPAKAADIGWSSRVAPPYGSPRAHGKRRHTIREIEALMEEYGEAQVTVDPDGSIRLVRESDDRPKIVSAFSGCARALSSLSKQEKQRTLLSLAAAYGIDLKGDYANDQDDE